MIDPSGNVGDIPYANMQAALKAGAKLGVNVIAPDGTPGTVPADRYQDAAKAGAKIVPYKDQDTQHPGFWARAADLMGGLLHPSGFSPYPGMDMEAKSQAATDSAKLNESEKAAGYSPLYRAAVPIARAAGTDVSGMEKSAKEGDVGGVAAAAAVPIATLGAAEALHQTGAGAKALDAAGDAIDAVREKGASVATAPVRLAARSAEAAINQKLVPVRPILNIMTPADEAGAIQVKVPGRDIGLSKPIPGPAAPFPAVPSEIASVEAAKALPAAFQAIPPKPAPLPGTPEHPFQGPPATESGPSPAQRLPAAFQPLPAKPPAVPGTVEAPFKPLTELPVPAVNQAIKELGMSAPISKLTERANNIAKLGDLLNEGLGGKGLEPNVPLKNQGGVSPTKLSAQPAIDWSDPTNHALDDFPGREQGSHFSKIQQVPIDQLETTETPSPEQIEKIKQQLKADPNQLPPITAEFSYDGPRGEDILSVVDGNTRLLAARELGLKSVPIRVHVSPDDWAHVQAGGGMEVRIPNSNLIEGHTPVDSSAVKSYKYNPTAKEIDIATPGGGGYRYAEISPEQAEAFGKGEYQGKGAKDTPSVGKAWADIRNNGTLVKKMVNGKWVDVKPQVSPEDEISPEEWQAGHELSIAVEGSPR